MYLSIAGCALSALSMMVFASCSGPVAIQPLEIRNTPAEVIPQIAMEAWVEEEVSVAEVGSGIMNPGLLAIGDTLTVAYPQARGVFEINAVEPVAGFTNVRAREIETPATVLLLSIGNDHVSGRLMEEDRLFMLHYDEDLATHFWLRVDPDKMDILPGGEPLEGP